MTLFCLICISCPAAVQPTGWQPHVSLPENRKSQLKDLASYVKKCLTIADWAMRSVTQSTHRPIMFSDPSSPLIEALPSHPWAKNKCDFGLITGQDCDPSPQRLITDHRQCPLCQEAVDSICAVFEALLKYGIIVACEESPFKTTRFFCKKRFSQQDPADLQPVKAAVLPSTILPSLHSTSSWRPMLKLLV